MTVNIAQFLEDANLEDSLYPGKRVVKTCILPGDHKSHCVVFDWRNPEELMVEVKAGLSGKTLAPEMVKRYPVCFQTPTYVKIAVVNDNRAQEDEDEDSDDTRGSGSGSGGRKPAKRKKTLAEIALISDRFGTSAKGKLPLLGKITDMMVMGVKIAKDAFDATFAELSHQINRARVSATEILSKTGTFITRVQPPSFIKPRGDETVKYKYDRLKNADIGYKTPGL